MMDGEGGWREEGVHCSLPQTCRRAYSMNESYCDATVMKSEGSRSARKRLLLRRKRGGVLIIWGQVGSID